MYFVNRAQAGLMLAEQLSDYRYENCVVVALNEGGVLVGEPIAAQLHCVMTMVLSEEIHLPGEITPIGTINQSGGFSYNSELSGSQIDEYQTEFRGYIEDKKVEGMHHINQIVGETGFLDRQFLKDQIIILVSDGVKSVGMLDAATEFLKPVRIPRLIVATPVASMEVVDKMHLLADELHILSVTDNYLDTNHYYDDNVVPDRDQILATIRQIILNWH